MDSVGITVKPESEKWAPAEVLRLPWCVPVRASLMDFLP